MAGPCQDEAGGTRGQVWQNPARVFEEEVRPLIQHFGWKLDGNKFVIEVKRKAVAGRLNRSGKMIILYSSQHN
jgi:hypothetical protein